MFRKLLKKSIIIFQLLFIFGIGFTEATGSGKKTTTQPDTLSDEEITNQTITASQNPRMALYIGIRERGQDPDIAFEIYKTSLRTQNGRHPNTPSWEAIYNEHSSKFTPSKYNFSNLATALPPSHSCKRSLDPKAPEFNPSTSHGLISVSLPSKKGEAKKTVWIPPFKPGLLKLPNDKAEENDYSFDSLVTYITPQEDGNCTICLDNYNEPVRINSCNDVFCKPCITESLQHNKKCPNCQETIGNLQNFGTQPSKGAQMRWDVLPNESLPGFEGTDVIAFNFAFKRGKDKTGREYKGRDEEGYLPNNPMGCLTLYLYRLAFTHLQMFDLGNRASNGEYAPVFGPHFKTTKQAVGSTYHGFPDEEYFSRTLEELESRGITPKLLQEQTDKEYASIE